MIYKAGNYSHNKINLLIPADGDVYTNVNFSQTIPHTKILEGIKGLTFHQCNLINCDTPIDATINGGNRVQVSRCSHLHPNWDIPQCKEECSHIINKDEITIDGVLIDTIYHYKDTIV